MAWKLKQTRMVPATNQEFLRPTAFVDSGDGSVRDSARTAVAGISGDMARAIALYKAVRDDIWYDPYVDYTDPSTFRASAVLAAGRGFCVGKSALLAACARAVGVPARLGFADVRNHLTSKRLRALTRSDIFVWHSYTELLIDGRWVKCTPAFDRALCERANLAPLDFDGVNCSTHSIRPVAGTWNICVTAAPLPTSPTRRSWAISAGTIPG